MPAIQCLRDEELHAYLLGDMTEPHSTEVAEHLGSCASCEAQAVRLERSLDPVLRSLRRALQPASTEDMPAVADTEDDALRPVALPSGVFHGPTGVGSNYEILGELGRGGMSVVYRARQHLPGRVVALKMILAGSLASAESRARFLAEANAIARLQHPGIVSIFEVGAFEEALFFSMELMEGGSLHDKLGGIPQPPAASAGLVAVISRAMDFAHGRGILHRDLKPANILLDREGTPKIADFGLARLEEPSTITEVDAKGGSTAAPRRGLTVTGAILGTPSYMAPEQANGDLRSIGPRTDVYALGAILYEMLTGRPPFRGTSMLETLEMVRSREPIPPLRLQPGTPRDLDTICLKCIARDPSRRYASAADLADDLDRFRVGKPIQARPVPAWEKALKAARRHPTASASATLAAGALASLLVMWTLFTVRLKAALDQSSRNATAANTQRARAEANQDKAFEGIDRFLTTIADKNLATIPGMEVVRRDLLNQALEVSQGFLKEEEGASSRVREEIARAHERCAKIHDALMNNPKQLDHVRQAVRLRRGLLKDNPGDSTCRFELAKALHNLGVTLNKSRLDDRVQLAAAPLEESLEIRQRLVRDAPGNHEYQSALANIHFALGALRRIQPGRIGEAEQEYEKALAIAEGLQSDGTDSAKYRSQLAMICNSSGVLHHSQGRMEPARQQWERARGVYQEILKSNPDDVVAQTGVAMTSNNLGTIYLALDRRTQALEAGQDAIRANEQLVRIHRNLPAYRAGLAGSHNNLARVYERYGPSELAEEHLRTACALSRELARDQPEVIAFQYELGKQSTNLASILSTRGKSSEARDLCREAVATLEPIVGKNPGDPRLAVSLAQAQYSLAHLQLSATGPSDEILAGYDRAIAGLEAVLRQSPGHAEARDSLQRARSSKACALFLAGSSREVLSTLQASGSEGWPAETLMKQLRGLSLASEGDWSHATAEARDPETLKAIENSPIHLFRLACVEARCGQAIENDKTIGAEARARLEVECEGNAVELIRRSALIGEALPADFQSWPASYREDVDWQLFRTVVQTPRFAFLLGLGYSRASSFTEEKREVLERQALGALRLAQAGGYFRQPDHLERLRTEEALAPLRRLPAFGKFVEDWEAGPS